MIIQAAKQPPTIWLLAFLLIGQVRAGIFLVVLSRHLGVACNTIWLLHNKILRVMIERKDAYVLWGKIQMDAASLGGEGLGGKLGRGSENKMPIVGAMSLNEVSHFVHAKPLAFGLQFRSDRGGGGSVPRELLDCAFRWPRQRPLGFGGGLLP